MKAMEEIDNPKLFVNQDAELKNNNDNKPNQAAGPWSKFKVSL